MAALTEKEKLSALVANFGEEMRRKLWFKDTVGLKGWNTQARLGLFRASLKEHIEKYNKGKAPWQLVDIANIAAILWYLEYQEPRKPRKKRVVKPKASVEMS
jgi:hypothetical protein